MHELHQVGPLLDREAGILPELVGVLLELEEHLELPELVTALENFVDTDAWTTPSSNSRNKPKQCKRKTSICYHDEIPEWTKWVSGKWKSHRMHE